MVFLCKIILISPLIPSGLYLAEGFVINSIDLIAVEGICFNNCAVGIFDSFPSTMTLTFEFPLRLISPVWVSTLTEGIPIMSSEAVPLAAKSFPIVITLRSTFC